MPPAGRSSGSSFGGPTTGFSNPFGDADEGRVYTPPTSGPVGGRDSGFTPGSFSADVTSPGAFVTSMQQNAQEGTDFIAGLGAALFGKDNDSMLGGLPVVGDLGRFLGDNLISQATTAVLSAGVNAVGGGLERVTIGYEDLTPRYQQLPADIRAEFDEKIAKTPEAANHFRYQALQAYADRRQLVNPKLHPMIDIPRGSLADTVGFMLGDLLGAPQREVERMIAGTGRLTTGMNRLQEIEAIAAGGVPTGIFGTGLFAGDRKLTEVESIAFEKWRSGEWSEDQALTFLAASGSGLSRDQLLQVLGTVATDPTVAGSLGAAGFAKLGLTGFNFAAREAAVAAKLARGEEVAESFARTGKLTIGTGRLTGERGTELVRLLSKPYVAIQGTSLGRAAKITRYIIDPLHAIGQKRVAQEAMVDIVSEAVPRAVVSAYGEFAHLDVLEYGRTVGRNGELYDMVTEDIATFGSNLARGIVAEAHQASVLSRNLGETLVQSVPGDIIDDLAKKAPGDIVSLVREKAAAVQERIWDDTAKANLARRMERVYGLKTEAEFLNDIKRMSRGMLSLLHAATYGRATKRFLEAIGKSIPVYTGKLQLDQMILLNRSTLTTLGARGLLRRLDEATDTAEGVRIVREAQELYPDLRHYVIDEANPARGLEKLVRGLTRRLEEGSIPAQVTADELAQLPDELRKLADDIDGAFTLGFKPKDEFLWGIEFDPDLGYRRVMAPWVDHVADAAPAFRAGRALRYNIAGQPIIGGIVRAATKPIDYLEAGMRMTTVRIASIAVSETARERYIAKVVERGTMTEEEARRVFQGVLDAAQVNNTTARGLLEKVMWREVEALVPQRLRLSRAYGKRELMADVLDAYEGDLRHVGLTQKFTGRVKKLLQPLGGNMAGYISENLYPTVKFRLNAIFQTQERIEGFVLPMMRGVNFGLGNKMNELDRMTDAILQKLVDTSVVRVANLDQFEWANLVLFGDESKQVLTGHFARDLWNTLSDVQGVKRVNFLRTFQRGLGGKLRAVWERNAPGAWDNIVTEYSARTGRVVSDDEAAVRYLAEQMLSNEITVNNLVKPGARAADFDAAINTAAFYVPATLGELPPLDLSFLVKRMQFVVPGAGTVQDVRGLREALALGAEGKPGLRLDDIQEALEFIGAHPDYIRRVRNALTFSWDTFWDDTVKKFNLSTAELRQLQLMMVKSAQVRGMSPVEFMSQVFSPSILVGTEATINELGKAVSILRAPRAGGTPEMLMDQLVDIFTAHLDPSAQRTLLEAFEKELPGNIQAAMDAGKVADSQALQKTLEELRGGWTPEAIGAFRDRVLAYADSAEEANPDVLRAVQQFAKWSKSALQDGLLSAGRPNPYSDLLTRVSGIQTDLAAPFNYTEQMLVNQAANAMRLKEQDAFMLQYFRRDRSWLERSINHPFFGIYPASYMWGKVAPEMIRFIAKEPFGVPTGAMAYSLADVQKAVAIQQEFDPEFDEMMEKIGSSQAVWFAGYLAPGVPWDLGAGLPSWMRDIADQGLENQERVARGQEPKPIDLGRPLRKVADYVSPFRPAFQVERVLDEVLEEQEADDDTQPVGGTPPALGATRAVNLGPTLEQSMSDLTRVLSGQ